MKNIFVTGIGTGVGKTIVSAIVTEALQADYWKPVQTGLVEGTDSEWVKRHISNTKTIIHPEAFCLKLPASPHAAAEAEGVSIKINDIKLPHTNNILVIEGAGGLMVPLNDKELMIDLIKKIDAGVLLVIKHYLGSINHSLLSILALQQYKIPVIGIVFNGRPNLQSEKAILSYANLPVAGRTGEEKSFSPSVISRYAKEFQQSFAVKSL